VKEMKMDNNYGSRDLKHYEKPSATALTREEAILKLRAYAVQGDEGARELLARIVASAPADNSDANKKKVWKPCRDLARQTQSF
jgi:hypothetical protein